MDSTLWLTLADQQPVVLSWAVNCQQQRIHPPYAARMHAIGSKTLFILLLNRCRLFRFSKISACDSWIVRHPASLEVFMFNWFWTGFTDNCPRKFYLMSPPDRGRTSGPGPLELSSTGNMNYRYVYFRGWATEGIVSHVSHGNQELAHVAVVGYTVIHHDDPSPLLK